MKSYKIIYWVAFFFIAVNFQRAHAQNKWVTAVDTFKITEAEVVDSTIIIMLDSAFTFLRLPAVESGLPYYYRLYFTKDKDTLFKNILNVSLFATDYPITDHSDLEDWYTKNQLLFIHKGIPILVYYNSTENYTLASRCFKPTSTKGNFYFYYKKDKYTSEMYRPNKWTEQTADFFMKRKYWSFMGYKLNIVEAESLKTHH